MRGFGGGVTEARIICGDALEVLRTMPDQLVQCCMTSPPYWRLRDYGVDGQIGLESTPAEYIEKMVAVFREVRRVLRDDGLLWLNIGDSYNGSKQSCGTNSISGIGGCQPHGGILKDAPGLKPKDLVGIPWMLAFALQADGWWLRQDIIWHKPNPMPESIRDRCTKAHEYVFLLSKSERYFFDSEAMQEPAAVEPSRAPRRGNSFARKAAGGRPPGQPHQHREDRADIAYEGKRNKRSVWTIASEPYPEAHFATFPTELPRICILAGTRPGDTVLDPFSGSGTTGQVAVELGRHYLGVELNPEYVAMSERRLAGATIGLPLDAVREAIQERKAAA